MILKDFMDLTENNSNILIEYGDNVVYVGKIYNLQFQIIKRFMDYPITILSTRIVKLNKRLVSVLYIYFSPLSIGG